MPDVDPIRLKPWFGDPPRTAIPVVPGYVPVAHERFDMPRGAIAGFVLMPLWSFLFVAAIDALGGRTAYSSAITVPNILIGAFIALVLVPVLHEAVHGVIARVFGARPAYGVGPGFAYTTFREPVGRIAYLVIGLAPIVLLSAASVLLAAVWSAGAGWLVFFAVINAGGAVGDLWMAWRTLRQPGSAIYYDLADGFAVFVPQQHPAAARAIIQGAD